MSTGLYRRRSKELLRGKYGEGFVVSAVVVAVFLIFKTLDLMLAAASVYTDGLNLSELIAGEGILETVFSIVRRAACFIVMVPLLTGGVWWFFQTASGMDGGNILKIYSGLRLNIRAAAVYGVMWLWGFVSLIPTGLCWLGAYAVFEYACQGVNQAVMLFAAVQLLAAGVFLLGLSVRTAAAVSAAPFIFIMHPDTGAFRSVRQSVKLMKGRKADFVKLMLCYVPAMLPLVTIPFVLPRAVMSAALFILYSPLSQTQQNLRT